MSLKMSVYVSVIMNRENDDMYMTTRREEETAITDVIIYLQENNLLPSCEKVPELETVYEYTGLQELVKEHGIGFGEKWNFWIRHQEVDIGKTEIRRMLERERV